MYKSAANGEVSIRKLRNDLAQTKSVSGEAGFTEFYKIEVGHGNKQYVDLIGAEAFGIGIATAGVSFRSGQCFSFFCTFAGDVFL